jgi:hypothetical protein
MNQLIKNETYEIRLTIPMPKCDMNNSLIKKCKVLM